MNILVNSTQKELEPNPTIPVRQDIKVAKKNFYSVHLNNGKLKKSNALYYKLPGVYTVQRNTYFEKNYRTVFLGMYNVYLLSFRY
jgi:hypothetical protein